ncbi:ACP S-malonyltransferase [Candidatus Desantisbacteria bacterium]|nr:ACP S-malonyltransferase [Candidatus Desantisbacteria bacterium]
MKTYVFPGQGTQRVGMGKDLFEEYKNLISIINEILGYSIEELCLKDPENNLNKTQYAQPAIFVVNSLAYLKKIKETVIKPDFVIGHSLGEYNALFAADAFNFETGLKLVKKRGELMSRMLDGGMAAIIGLCDNDIKRIINDNELNTLNIANYNTPLQIVIAGPKSDIIKSQTVFEKNGCALFVLLNVNGAFHTHYMEAAKREFDVFLKDISFSELQITVIANITGKPHKNNEIKKNLVEHFTNPVRFTDSILFLLSQGVSQFEEIGESKVLTGLIQKMKKEIKPQ